MKRTTRGLLVILFSFILIFITGCKNTTVSYTDPNTGEEREIKIEKTSTEQEVADSIYAIALSDTKIKDSTETMFDMDFDFNLKDLKNNDNTIINGSLLYSMKLKDGYPITNDDNMYKAYEIYMKFSCKGSTKEDGKEYKVPQSIIELFVDDGMCYIKFDLDQAFVDLFEDSGIRIEKIFKWYNGKVIWFDLKETLPVLGIPLDINIEDTSEMTVKELLEEYGSLTGEEINLDNLRSDIDTIVKELGIKITSVRGSEVTYQIDISNYLTTLTKDATCLFFITIDVQELSISKFIVDIKIKNDDYDGTFKIESNFQYKAKITKISDSDKEIAVSGNINDFINDYN